MYTTALRATGEEDNAQVAVCLRIVTTAFAETRLPQPIGPADGSKRWILTFDGGSRGNPGPGRAGYALIRVSADERCLEWCAGIHMPLKATPNNEAEVRGLLEVLRQAWRQQASPLEVIGDSALILGWMRRHRQPKKPNPRRLYDRARHFADRIQITAWTHHYRTANRTADFLANTPMDDKCTFGVRKCRDPAYQARPTIWAQALEYASTDLLPWELRQAANRQPP